MNKTFEKLGFYPADILLPKDQDMTKWAVVACDQFTSEPEYWQAVEEKVGKAPSTLRLILPEANLKGPQRGRVHLRHQRCHGAVSERRRIPDAGGLPDLCGAPAVRRTHPPRPHRHGGSGRLRLQPPAPAP